MSCDMSLPTRQVNETLDRLEEQLENGTVKAKVGANGAVVFDGWEDRDGLSDACAYRKLSARGSSALRKAIGPRVVNLKAIAAGVHSHDGGKTWHPGHKRRK